MNALAVAYIACFLLAAGASVAREPREPSFESLMRGLATLCGLALSVWVLVT